MNPSSRVSTSDRGDSRAFQCGTPFKFRQLDCGSTVLTDDNIHFTFASDYPPQSMLLLPGGYQPTQTIETPWIHSLFPWNPSGRESRCQMEPDTGFVISGPHHLSPRPTVDIPRGLLVEPQTSNQVRAARLHSSISPAPLTTRFGERLPSLNPINMALRIRLQNPFTARHSPTETSGRV
jgi:hypothetical protein